METASLRDLLGDALSAACVTELLMSLWVVDPHQDHIHNDHVSAAADAAGVRTEHACAARGVDEHRTPARVRDDDRASGDAPRPGPEPGVAGPRRYVVRLYPGSAALYRLGGGGGGGGGAASALVGIVDVQNARPPQVVRYSTHRGDIEEWRQPMPDVDECVAALRRLLQASVDPRRVCHFRLSCVAQVPHLASRRRTVASHRGPLPLHGDGGSGIAIVR